MMRLNEWAKNEKFSKLVSEHVPSIGHCNTPYGEAIRAVMRLEFEFCENHSSNAKLQFFQDMHEILVLFIKRHVGGSKTDVLNKYARLTDLSKRPSAQQFNEAIAAIKQWFVDNPGIADRYLDELS